MGAANQVSRRGVRQGQGARVRRLDLNSVIPAAFLSGNPWFDRLTMSEKLTMHPELVEGLDSCQRHAGMTLFRSNLLTLAP